MRLGSRYLRAATSFASTTTLSPTVTMRSASEVDAAIEAACAGDSHGAQTPVSAIGRGRWGRRRRVQARTAAASRSALQHVSTKCLGYVRITHRTSRSGASANVDYDWLENLVCRVTYRNCFIYLREIVSKLIRLLMELPSDAHQSLSSALLGKLYSDY